MRVTLVDPLCDAIPREWDHFVAEQRLFSLWRSALLVTSAWCAQSPTVMVVVMGPDATALALFHARLLGPPHRPAKFLVPGSRPFAGVLECRLHPVGSFPGYAFAAHLDSAAKSAAVTAFEGAVGEHFGARCPAVAYRHVAPKELPLVKRRKRISMRVEPHMVLQNRWSDVADYLLTLERKWRAEIRRIRRAVEADPTVQVAIETHLSPTDAARLVEVVRTRHRRPVVVQPPVPVPYLEELAAASDTRFITYREDTGRLLAFCALHDNGTELVSGYWGNLDPQDGGRRNVYFDVYLRSVELMIEHGRRELGLGKGMAAIKARFGATAHDRYAVAGAR
jgi:hypothetical protein